VTRLIKEAYIYVHIKLCVRQKKSRDVAGSQRLAAHVRQPRESQKMNATLCTNCSTRPSCSALPARCYPRDVIADLCTRALCRLRRRNRARLCGVPQNPLLLAPAPPRRGPATAPPAPSSACWRCCPSTRWRLCRRRRRWRRWRPPRARARAPMSTRARAYPQLGHRRYCLWRRRQRCRGRGHSPKAGNLPQAQSPRPAFGLPRLRL